MTIVLVVMMIYFRPRIETFDNTAHRRIITSIARDMRRFVEMPDLMKIPGRTVILDFDDTIVHSRPWNNHQYISSSPRHFPGVEPVVKFVKRAVVLGYCIVVVTARRSRRSVTSNLRGIGIYPDAVFAHFGKSDIKEFKARVRKCVERSYRHELYNKESFELFSQTHRPPGIDTLKIVLNVGDQWSDIGIREHSLGVKLPGRDCYTAWYAFNGDKRRAV